MACIECGTDHAPDRPCPNPQEASDPSRSAYAPAASTAPHGNGVGGGAVDAIARDIEDELAGDTVQRKAPSPKDAADALIGTTIGSFRIVRRLGQGGMGTVYLGEQTVIGSKVAVKILHSHLASNDGLVQRFYAEARAVNLIGHENIVSIFDMNVVPPNRYYLIMEYLEGKPLTSLLKGTVTAEVAIPILNQVCDALQAAHSHGVVHRDLKPENIFLIKRGRNEHFVKILDFGIAKLYGQEEGRKLQEQTAAGMLVGTPEYMSPEQCTGAAVDGRADIYALGIISYLLATGRLPFSGGGLTTLLLAHREQIPPTPHDVNPKVPVPWSSAIMRALAKRPQDRFQDAGEMRDALERALESTRPRPSSSRPSPPPAEPEPAVAGTPMPVTEPSRQTTSFMASVATAGGQEISRLRCVDVSRGGVFLCAEGQLPPVFSRVKLSLEIEGSVIKCDAEVVRHVTADQARAWNMSPGFGVQFVDTTPAFREQIARAVQGVPLGSRTTQPPSRAEDDDRAAEPLLEHYRKRLNGDHYVVLSMAQDAEIADLRARGRDARRDLESLRARRLSARQDAQVASALDRLGSAIEVLGTPLRRAEYDAHRGNFKGVARCISAGLTVSELENLRGAYLSSHRGSDSRAQIHFSTGQAWETKGSLDDALAEFERALALDPLNLRFHQRYWALKRKVAGPKR